MSQQSEQQAGREDTCAHNCCDQSKFAHAIDIIRATKPGSIGDWATIPAILNSQIGAKYAHGEVETGFCLPELRSRGAKMAGPVRYLRRMEYAGSGDFECKPPQKKPRGAETQRRFIIVGGRGDRGIPAPPHRLDGTGPRVGWRTGPRLRDIDRRG